MLHRRRTTLATLATLTLALSGACVQIAYAQARPAQLQAAGSEIAFTTRQLRVAAR